MKTLAALLLLTANACAAQPPHSSEPTAVTGTHITKLVKRLGHTYDTPQTIRVIDRQQIERSGARTLAQLLRREPGVRVR